MKILIIFLGMLLISVTFIAYQGDMGKYLQLQTYLKAAAEEAAAGASLYYDEEEFSRGLMVIDREDAEAYVQYITAEAASQLALAPLEGESLTYEMEIRDREPNPSVIVTLRLTTRDIFRLNFLEVTQITRQARYELAEY